MAKEILILGAKPSSDGLESYNLMFFYPIDPLIAVNGVTVVPTPSTALPEEVVNYNLLTAGEKAVLDSGAYMYQVVNYTRPLDVSKAQMLEKIKAIWVNHSVKIPADIREYYSLTGTRLDVV